MANSGLWDAVRLSAPRAVRYRCGSIACDTGTGVALVNELNVKGLTFSSVLGAIEELKGPDFRREVVQGMTDEPREAIELGAMIASGWYPLCWYREMFESAVALDGTPSFPREVGRASVMRDVQGVHRVLMRVITIDMLQRSSSRLFEKYFQPAELRVERLAKTSRRVSYLGCGGFDHNLWQEQLGVHEELLKHTGVKAPRVRIASGGRQGDPVTELELSWR